MLCPECQTVVYQRTPVCRCGETEGVVMQPDPFAEEIHGDDTPRPLCEYCAYQSAQDI